MLGNLGLRAAVVVALAHLRQQHLGIERASFGCLLQRALRREGVAVDVRAGTRLHFHLQLGQGTRWRHGWGGRGRVDRFGCISRCSRRDVASDTAHRHLRVEVALGFQQGPGLCRGRCDQAVDLGRGDVLSFGHLLEARQIEVGLQQCAQVTRGVDVQLVQRDRGLGCSRGIDFLGRFVAEELLHAGAATGAEQHHAAGQHCQRAQPFHGLSARMAASRPGRVSGYMRWCMSC